MICQPCGGYANATVDGQYGGRIPVCDDCIGTEPEAVYRTPTQIFPSRSRPRMPRTETHKAAPVPAPAVVGYAQIHDGTNPPPVAPRAAPCYLELPEPPSANRWWRMAHGRMHRSHEAADYMTMLREHARVSGAALFPSPVELSIVVVWRRERKAGDLDKRLGVLLDAMQTWTDKSGIEHPGIYDNDSQVVQLWARRCDEHAHLKPGTVWVEIGVAK